MLAYCASASQAFEPNTAMELHKCADFYQIAGLQQATAEYGSAYPRMPLNRTSASRFAVRS